MRSIETHSRSALAARLLRARQTAGLSLAQVTASTGVSASFLSAVEQGKSDISISRLMRLVNCYKISITDLVDDGRPHGLHVVRSDDRKTLALDAEGISIFMLAPEREHMMMPVLLEYAVGGQMDDPAEHQGEEFVFVLEGELELEMGGSEIVVLTAGDSAYYRADVRHTFRNVGEVPVRFIGVATPPNL